MRNNSVQFGNNILCVFDIFSKNYLDRRVRIMLFGVVCDSIEQYTPMFWLMLRLTVPPHKMEASSSLLRFEPQKSGAMLVLKKQTPLKCYVRPLIIIIYTILCKQNSGNSILNSIRRHQ